MSSSLEALVGCKRPRTRSETQRVVEDLVDNFPFTQQQGASREWSSIPDLNDNYLDKSQSEQVSFYDIWGDDNMPYPYSQYRDGVDAEVHIRDFLTTVDDSGR